MVLANFGWGICRGLQATVGEGLTPHRELKPVAPSVHEWQPRRVGLDTLVVRS